MKIPNCRNCGGESKLRSQGFNTNSVVCSKCHNRTASRPGNDSVKYWAARDADLIIEELKSIAVECPPGVDAVSFSKCMHAAFIAFELELKR